jgi:hypothetical protein
MFLFSSLSRLERYLKISNVKLFQPKAFKGKFNINFMKSAVKWLILLLLAIILINAALYLYFNHFKKAEPTILFAIGDSEIYPGNNSLSNTEIVINNNIGRQTILIFPIMFYKNASNIDFEIGCYTQDEALLRMDAYHRQYEEGKYKTASVIYNNSGYDFFSYFGIDSASPFILSNNQNFGTHIDYVNKGTVRLIMIPSAWVNSSYSTSDKLIPEIFRCTITLVSRSPPERVQKDFELSYRN